MLMLGDPLSEEQSRTSLVIRVEKFVVFSQTSVCAGGINALGAKHDTD